MDDIKYPQNPEPVSNQDHNFSSENPLKETFKKENIKSLIKTEPVQRIIRGGIATIIAILFFFMVMSFMLPGKRELITEPAINNDQNSNEPNPTSSAGTISTQVGNTTSPTLKQPQTTTQPSGNSPVQKSQIYTIGQDFSSVTFTATYEDPNLLVDFVVIDPDGNSYTIGDEEKYEGRLTTEWKSTSRTIKISGDIKKGSWTADLAASKNVPITIKLTGTPK